MKIFIFISLFMLLTLPAIAQTDPPAAELIRMDADPAKGFRHAFYLFVPKELAEPAALKKTHSFVVIPNNTGSLNDDIAFHDANVKRKMEQIGPALKGAGIAAPILMPVFPRPAEFHNIYTHSLDRDIITTEKPEYSRLDKQLAAMIEAARSSLKTRGITTERKVLMQGYSASGMFVSRFVMLHPGLVKAAAIGAPGGWPIAPVAEYKGRKLTYPAGIADVKDIAGKSVDIESVRKVPLFLFLGDQDTNDAVPMGDAYDRTESDLVIELFGKTPVERYPFTEKLYREAKLNVEFKLYPGATHQMSKEMRDDQIAFLKRFVL